MSRYLPHKFAPHPVNLLPAPEWVDEAAKPDFINVPFPLETLDAEGVPEIGYKPTPISDEYWAQYFQFITFWFKAGYWWWCMAKPAVSDREFDEVERRISYLEREVLDELKPYKGLPLPMGTAPRRFHPMWSTEKYPHFILTEFVNCPIRLRFPWEGTKQTPPVQERTFAKRPPKIR